MLVVYIVLGIFLGGIFLAFLLAHLIHHTIFGKRWDPDGITKYYSFPELKAKPIQISTKKGTLQGNLYSYPGKLNRGILVFAHGMWGSHKAYMQEIEFLAEEGYQVLGFDYYGTELSEGKNIRGLGNSLLSLDVAISYMKKTFPKEAIYVMGHSWGGFAALGIAKFHPDLKKIVAMSPFITESKIFRHLLPKLCYPLIPFIVLIDAIHCGKYSFVNARKVLKKTQVNTYILHSLDDPMVPYKISTEFLQKTIKNPNLQYEIVNGKRHNPDYTLEALMYTQNAFAELKSISNPEQKAEYRRNMDYHRMGEIDRNISSKIVEFLKKE